MSNAAPNTTRQFSGGLGFSYASWTAETEVTLTNVPWNNDYRDIVSFPEGASIDKYIAKQPSTRAPITDVNYAKPMQPIRLNVPFNVAMRYNYLRAALPMQPIDNDIKKSYYYFITDIQYIAPGTTQFNLQLDVWQTFGADVTFGNSYIERGHIGIAHTKNFDNYGRDYLTTPEGLDIGNEYRHVAKRTKKIFEKNTGNVFRDFNILVCTTVKLEDIDTSTAKPNLVTASGDMVQGLPSGAEYYVFRNVAEFTGFMKAYQVVPWITQGIISITVVPNVARYGYALTRKEGRLGIPMWKVGSTTGQGDYRDMFTNWRESNEILGDIPRRYRHLKKFLTFPYLTIEVTTWTGSPIVLKPESWAEPNARLNEKIALTSNSRVVIYPHKYNANPSAEYEKRNNGVHTDYYDDNGDYLDISTQITNFPQLAIVNNQAIGVLAAQRNAINQQFAAADWSQQRALAGNANSYDQASAASATMAEQGRISRNQDIYSVEQSNSQAGLRAMQAGANSVAGSLLVPTPASAAGSAIGIGNAALGMAIETTGANAQLGIRNNAANASQSAAIGNQNYVRDTNKSLADWAAKGDYEQSIAGINAKVQDARLTQPSTSGQVGGEAFNLINDSAEVSVRFKLIGPNELSIIGEYWLRYGYSVRRFGIIPKSLMVMTKFTYWKLAEAYLINTRLPEAIKQAIRGIFEKGVTVWADPDNIGNIDIADNEALPGVTLDNQPATPAPLPVPDPIDPDPEDDDKVWNIAIQGVVSSTGVTEDGNFTVGKEFVKKLDGGAGVQIASAIAGEFIGLTVDQGRSVYRLLGIPVEYISDSALRADWPDGLWSRELENERDAVRRDLDNKTLLEQIIAAQGAEDGTVEP
jgi:hypothetical protein